MAARMLPVRARCLLAASFERKIYVGPSIAIYTCTENVSPIGEMDEPLPTVTVLRPAGYEDAGISIGFKLTP